MPPSLQLRIPKPCHEQWDVMKPEEGGRHCARCQKTVVDFTAMTDSEIIARLAQAGQGVCGRFNANQLHRNFLLGIPPKSNGGKGWPWLLAACLVTARPNQPRPDRSSQQQARTKLATAKCDRHSVTMGKPGDAIPVPDFVSERVVKDSSVVEVGAISVVLQDNTVQQEVPVADTAVVDTSEVFPSEMVFAGGIVMRFGERVDSTTIADSLSKVVDSSTRIVESPTRMLDSFKQIVTDTLTTLHVLPSRELVVYPNPVNRGAVVSLSWQTDPGSYQVTIFNAAGAVIQTRTLEVTGKQQVDLLNIPLSAARGVYILRAGQSGNGKVYSRKLLVL